MKISIFLGFISLSNCAHLQKVHLREKSDRTFTKVISAKIGDTQDFVCPRDQEFSIYFVSNEEFRQCKQYDFIGKPSLHDCNTPWKEKKVRFQ